MSHKDVSQECLARVSSTRGLKRGSIRVRGFYQVFSGVYVRVSLHLCVRPGFSTRFSLLFRGFSTRFSWDIF